MRHKVLIVDDQKAIFYQVGFFLKSLGYEYEYVSDPQLLFETLEAHRFDVILLDIQLNEVNGIDLLKEIKSNEKLGHIPVIMMTGFTEAEVLSECFEHGADDYITKPLEKLIFSARIHAVVKRQEYLQELSVRRELISRQKDLLIDQNKLLEENGKDIQASINYARRIQEAILPSEAVIQEAFAESFILFKPRNIVSGDFYWYTQQGDIQVIAAVDCTGHGVPGAFMSMLGNTLLNDIVIHQSVQEPGDILLELDKNIRFTLQQKGQINDGMDISVCVVDQKQQQLSFAGAHLPLVYIQKNVLTRVKGSRAGIGGYGEGKVFETHQVDISEPTSFYIFSDGYQDQFGGKDKRKFSNKRFCAIIEEIHQKPMNEQKAILEKQLLQWMYEGNEKQLDDVMVLGVKIGNR